MSVAESSESMTDQSSSASEAGAAEQQTDEVAAADMAVPNQQEADTAVAVMAEQIAAGWATRR